MIAKTDMNHQKVIDFIEKLCEVDLRLIHWEEFEKMRKEKKEAIEYIRKLAGVH